MLLDTAAEWDETTYTKQPLGRKVLLCIYLVLTYLELGLPSRALKMDELGGRGRGDNDELRCASTGAQRRVLVNEVSEELEFDCEVKLRETRQQRVFSYRDFKEGKRWKGRR